MNKICPRCRKIYSYSYNKCPNGCNTKARKEYNQIYDLTRKHKDIYNSNRWKHLRKLCFNRFKGICLWSYYEHNKIILGRIAHHIIPIDIDSSKCYELDNLIFLSDKAHQEIHSLINNSSTSIEMFINNNKELLNKIKSYITRWENEEMGGI